MGTKLKLLYFSLPDFSDVRRAHQHALREAARRAAGVECHRARSGQLSSSCLSCGLMSASGASDWARAGRRRASLTSRDSHWAPSPRGCARAASPLQLVVVLRAAELKRWTPASMRSSWGSSGTSTALWWSIFMTLSWKTLHSRCWALMVRCLYFLLLFLIVHFLHRGNMKAYFAFLSHHPPHLIGLYCNATTDEIGTCWPRSSTGRIVERPCPAYINGVKYNTTSKNKHKFYNTCLKSKRVSGLKFETSLSKIVASHYIVTYYVQIYLLSNKQTEHLLADCTWFFIFLGVSSCSFTFLLFWWREETHYTCCHHRCFRKSNFKGLYP